MAILRYEISHSVMIYRIIARGTLIHSLRTKWKMMENLGEPNRSSIQSKRGFFYIPWECFVFILVVIDCAGSWCGACIYYVFHMTDTRNRYYEFGDCRSSFVFNGESFQNIEVRNYTPFYQEWQDFIFTNKEMPLGFVLVLETSL